MDKRKIEEKYLELANKRDFEGLTDKEEKEYQILYEKYWGVKKGE